MNTALRYTLAAVLALALAAACGPARAQDGGTIPPEVTRLFQAIDDIDKLRVLNPLHLTASQLGQIAVIIEKSQRDFNRTLADAAVPPIRQIAESISGTRTRLLTGGEVPADFDARVKSLQAEYVKRRETAERSTVVKLAADIHAVLEPEQFTKAARMMREHLTKESSAKPTGTEEQFFNLYVAGTFIAYPRIVPLLKDMQAALSPAGASRPAHVAAR